MEKNRTQTCVSIQPRCHRNLHADHRSYRMPLIGVVAWRSTVPDKNEILQHSASHPPRGSRFPLAIGSMPRYPFPTVSSFCSSSARFFAVPPIPHQLCKASVFSCSQHRSRQPGLSINDNLRQGCSIEDAPSESPAQGHRHDGPGKLTSS